MGDVLDKFLNDQLEYITNRYEELRLQYSNNPELKLENLKADDVIDREYMAQMCKLLSEKSDEIDAINK